MITESMLFAQTSSSVAAMLAVTALFVAIVLSA